MKIATPTAVQTRHDRSSYTCRSPRNGENNPYEGPLPRLSFLDRESVANVQGLGSLPIVRVERKIGSLSGEIMQRLKGALALPWILNGLRNEGLIRPGDP